MRFLLWVGLALALGTGVALLAAQDPGYLLVYWNGWQIESRSLVITVAILLLLFFLLHWLLNLGGDLRRGGEQLGRFGAMRRQARARRSLVKGLLELAEGRWQSAERWLVKHVADSDTPLLNYLAAARAAGQLGAAERRDRYLAKAHDTTPGADIAIGLSQAEEQLRAGQYEQCLATLQHLHSLDAKHPHVLQMLLRVFGALNDPAAQLQLLPRLRRGRLLAKTELTAIERDCYTQLLTQGGDPADVWSQVPRDLQHDADLVALYTGLLQKHGDEQAALNHLQNELRNHWHSNLAALYGELVSRDVEAHLAVAKRWSRRHGEDPGLLLTLARLYKLAGQVEESATYFERAIALNPTVDALREYGHLLEAAGDIAGALRQCRAALEQAAPLPASPPALTVAAVSAEHPG